MPEKCVQLLQERLTSAHYQLLIGIPNPALHRFVADSVKLCNPDSVYVCTDSEEDLEHVRRQTVESAEEITLGIPGHTCHFDGMNDQGRDRETVAEAAAAAFEVLKEQRRRLQQLQQRKGDYVSPFDL